MLDQGATARILIAGPGYASLYRRVVLREENPEHFFSYVGKTLQYIRDGDVFPDQVDWLREHR